MSWSIPQVGVLFKLAESGELTADELGRAAQDSPLRPVRQAWLLAADRLFAFAGVALLASALIFFFAWNWPDLHRFAKLSLAIAALSACAGTAIISPPFGTVYRAGLFGACLFTGALLALITQIYQTGADPWELFATWTALMLPFALLARSSASWALWLAVGNVAIMRAISQQPPWLELLGEPSGAGPVLLLAGLNLAVLAAFEFAGSRLLVRPRRDLQRLAALGVLGPLVVAGLLGWWIRDFRIVTLAFVVVAVGMLLVYLRLRRDLPILGLASFGAIAVLSSGLIKLLPAGEDWGVILYNVVALAVILASAGTGRWLLALYREDRQQ
jgi:uncharacterized membrane protein